MFCATNTMSAEIDIIKKKISVLKPQLKKQFGKSGSMEYQKLANQYNELVRRLKKLTKK